MDKLDDKILTIQVTDSILRLKFLNFENSFKKYKMNLLVLKINNLIIEDSINYELNNIDILNKINLNEKFIYIFFSVNYYVDNSILAFLKKKYNFNFIDYSSELGWCSIIVNNKIDNEYIFFDNIINFKINLKNKNYFIEDCELESRNIIQKNKDDKEYYDTYNIWLKFINEIKDVEENIKKLSITNLSKKINEIDKFFLYIDNYLKEQNENINLLREIDNKKKKENKNFIKIYDIDYNKLKLLQKEIVDKESILKKINSNIYVQEKRLNTVIDKLNNNLIENNLNFYHGDTNLEKFERDLGIMVHLYDISLWGEIENYLNNLVNLEIKFDLYVNISYNLDSDLFKKEYKKLKAYLENYQGCENFYYTTSNNKGMDIGGFLNSYLKKLKLGIIYKSIIKIHSKTNKNWRFAMLYSLLGSQKIIENNLNLLKNDKVGMIGNDKISVDLVLKINKESYKYIYTYFDRFNIKTNKYGFFIPGSIFWIKDEILMKYLNERSIVKTYKEFKPYYCGSKKNDKEGKPHAFERLFGVMVQDCKKLTLKVIEKI